MKIHISQASGQVLDWLVGTCVQNAPVKNLRDFGEALLPAEFDLCYDIKHLSEIDTILAGGGHCSGLTPASLRKEAMDLGYYIDRVIAPPYSSDRNLGGPLLDQDLLSPYSEFPNWRCQVPGHAPHCAGQIFEAPTSLAAGLLCVVAARMGSEVEVPDSLFTHVEPESPEPAREPLLRQR